ncbi:hypothetical protein [Mesobacillus jeotgali]|uniref:hypothetical protein n=1 Tax=Mesobacillus jeotgali TaxID=129985 RepID=UPI00177DDCF9|nr:hypothetical protein [Mesobacillus jeotgali]UYZ24054.1 hypothetical protein FOF60_11170 [Mesobacillus jeotgali]
MEKQILDILLSMQKDLSGVKEDVSTLKADMTNVKEDISALKGNVTNLQNSVEVVQADIKEVKATVDRIEAAQTEDVIGILKLSKKKTDFEVDYLNNRLTEMDKRIYVLEKTVQN